MNRERFAWFLGELKAKNDNGEDIDAFVKQYENETVYIYNDACLRKIFATQANLPLTTDLLNASLNLIGSDRIMDPSLRNPFIPGDLGYRSVEPDIVLTTNGENGVKDRISIEFQHEGGDLYKDRLVLYVSRHESNMVKPGEVPKLDNLHIISFQLFDTFPWVHSKNYRHTIKLMNQDHDVFFDKLTITLVEVKKFRIRAAEFAGDYSRIAQWLRAIDALNENADFTPFANDPVFRLLQQEVKLCNFSSRFLLKEAMGMTDMTLVKYNAAKENSKQIARNMLAEGASIEFVAKTTKLTVEEIKAL
ncbi:MAG: Rpn family recombination-promoting nuclease/putative transposase [Fibrobacter sp.]|nr:Rpn family recombination-promoting nuclease/putative transposase [Fibrobacter sp.]